MMLGSVLLAATMLAGAQPIDFVKELMRYEVEFIEMSGQSGPFTDEALAVLFSEDFADAYNDVLDLAEARDEPLLDGDPITGRQEYCPLRGIHVEAGVITQTTATVTARFMSQTCFDIEPAFANEVTEIVFHFVREDGEWAIDDFDHSLYGSFRGLLNELAAM